ncbi:phage tail protein [Pseudomonas frederiksbergensis]|uniref:Phage tail protein n=1 Tax=Pseudomonas frederiksbergensis TaxID=104087 RepID=A0A6L5C3J9_9PSED|nr:phage tail protein [Pseudomonas frederiksbergensis]KAF2395399.1 hypothetical protein FX983_03384 [Pseudomonas frederiksbergensis]
MTMYYYRVDATRCGFLNSAVHGEIGSPDCTIPEGAKEITEEQHAELVAAQSNGKLIVPGPDGCPLAIDPPPLSVAEQEVAERAWRDAQLAPTDGIVSRHRDELEEGIPTTLTAEQYAELQVYRRLLRNWPQGAEFPLVDHRPVSPGWLTGPLQ